MDTQSQSVPTMTSGVSMWLGLRMFLSDVGVSAAVGFVVGMFMIAARFDVNDIVQNPIIPIIGLAISVYMAYALGRRFSGEMAAFATLLGAAVLWSGLNILIPATHVENYNLPKDMIMFVAQMLSYGMGWYLAKQVGINLYIPKDIWFKISAGVGVVTILFGLLGIVSIAAS